MGISTNSAHTCKSGTYTVPGLRHAIGRFVVLILVFSFESFHRCGDQGKGHRWGSREGGAADGTQFFSSHGR